MLVNKVGHRPEDQHWAYPINQGKHLPHTPSRRRMAQGAKMVLGYYHRYMRGHPEIPATEKPVLIS
jgi:hypothetical protein